jgi:hypothetical protein
MSKDDKELELLSSSSTDNTIWTDEDSKKVLKEIKFDSWDANGSPITINTTDYLSPHGTDTITVNTAELDLKVNGLKQGDLFNGWPEDGEPQVITVTLDDIKD